MRDERARRGQSQPPTAGNPAEEARHDIEQASKRAERRLEELRDEAREGIERTEEAAKDRDEAGERTVQPRRRPAS